MAAVVLGILVCSRAGFGQAASDFTTETQLGSRVSPEMAAFGSRGVYVHDPSTIVKCEGEYWVFYTGPGLPSYHSKDLMKWEPGPPVFTNTPGWVDRAVPEHRGDHFWAPDVIHVPGRYLLYYSVSTLGKKVSAIGLATTPTLDPDDPAFGWADQGLVVQSTATNDFNTIDPAVSRDAGGKMWLSFGSYWSGIKLIQLNPETGKRISPDSPMYSLAHSGSIEASYIFHHGPYYYLFVNWGSCCRGTNSTYNIRVGRSKEITGPYLDRSGVNMLDGGGSLFLGSQKAFVGPGHAGILSDAGTNWFSCHFYDGTRGGIPTLAILPMRWTTDGWPEIIRDDIKKGRARYSVPAKRRW
jgi:arabinan endo-1,5-alpha-L-arabinosidase